ncbi:MAG TPA: glycosyltransferase family 39 protein [Bryobacteraceae bacterium]|nr:glycosyltransferase family 39 protein [Bryobacteraceae bacterium]
MPASKSSKSSPTSKKLVKRGQGRKSSSAPVGGMPWGVLLFLAALSSAAVLYFWRQGYLLWYGDATAHLNIARRILDGRHPGYEQIGTVWLPLPHVLMMPFAAVDALWRSGLAGAIPSAACFVAAGLLLYLIARQCFQSKQAGWAAVLLFALNPNMLYLQALAMTEAIFVCAVLLVLWASLRDKPWLAGLGLLAATLTRYEGWFLIPFVCLYFFWRDRWAGILVGLIASAGPLYWLGHNYVFHGDPLDFYHGVGSAKWIYQQAIEKGYERAPGDGDWWTAIRYYAMAGRLFAGLPLVCAGLAGMGLALWKRAWWAVFFLLLGPLFFVWSMHGSGATIFVPNLHPHSYYNTRYGMIVLPLLALCAAAIPAVMPEGAKKWAAVAVVAIGICPWVAYPKQQNWVTWKESEVNSEARREWTAQAAAYLRERYVPGRGIVAHFGDQSAIFREAGIPFRQTVHDGDGLYFQGILQRPDLFLWQEWVVAVAGDGLSKSMAANAGKLRRYSRVKMIETKDARAIEIWRRAAP